MSYVNHYDLWSNYYQHCGQQLQDEQQMKQNKQQDNSKQDNPRVKDLIDKALAKQCAKNSDDKNVTPIEMVKTDEDVEEGQIVCSPKQMYREDSSDSTPSKASSPMTPLDSSVTRNSSKSRSHSPSKARLLKSRSRSRSRRYHSHSRSRSRTPSRVRRRRSRSRSRSPYLGPIIKDYRRGRRAYIRYPRGYRVNIRPYRRTPYSSNYHLSYGFSRRNEFSRSRSRSVSPKRRQSRSPVENEKIASNDEKTSDGKHPENLKPSDIKISQKKITQSFLAMLEEKQNKSKMVPIMSNKSFEMTEGDEAFNKQHGFVNTFNTVREIDGQKHTLSYDLEREGWQVIDDASSESGHHRRHKTSKDSVYRYESTVAKNSERGQYVSEDKQISQRQIDDSSSSEEETKKKKKKTKKRKKRKKRKSSTSNESSISESDEDIGEEEIGKKKNKKKKNKKKKKTSKKKKKKVNSPSSSDNEEKESKHKKKKKKKKKTVSSDTDSKEKADETVGVLVTAQILTEDGEEKKDVVNEILRDVSKIKDKKRKRKAESSSTETDSDKNVKKKKKKNKKKKAKKRKHHSSSSSSSSETSDSSESFQKKKKRKKSKKSKRTKKNKKEKKSDKKDKTKLSNDDNKKSMNDEDIKQSEFVTVYSIGEPSLELKWPKNLINFTSFEPSLQFSINPKVIYSAEDFLTVEDKRKCSVDLLQRKDNEKLASEYERFIDELKPAVDFTGVINEQSLALEVKMREKLLKQMGDNCKQTSEEQNLVTPSEKRAMEKMKKQYQKISDEQEAQRRHEELKSAPLSTYYSVKRQHKSSDHENEDLGKSVDSSSKLKESSDVFCKTDDISMTIVDRTNKQEDKHGFDYGSKVDDKKKTARELLERVKQKKSSGKESNDDTKNSKRSLHIGKIKKPPKKDNSKKSASSTTGSVTDNTQKTPFVSKPMKLDINYDYNWYYQYYRNNYGMGQYPSNITSAAAYYAQYALITSYDYSHQDLSNWMHSKGYLLENAPKSKENNISLNKKAEEVLNIHKDDIKLSENSTEPKIESTKPEVIPDGSSEIKLNSETEKIDANELIECNQTQSIESKDNESKSESFGKISDLNASHTNDNNLNMQQNIEVIVSSVHNNMTLKHLNNTDKSENDCAPNLSPFCSANMKHKVKVRVTTNSQSELGGETCASPPPPPPPPKRPKMTTFTSMNAITLPNGQVLPAGTKQIVVHPYQYPYSNRFSAQWYYNAFEAHNTAKTAAIDTQSIIAN